VSRKKKEKEKARKGTLTEKTQFNQLLGSFSLHFTSLPSLFFCSLVSLFFSFIVLFGFQFFVYPAWLMMAEEVSNVCSLFILIHFSYWQ